MSLDFTITAFAELTVQGKPPNTNGHGRSEAVPSDFGEEGEWKELVVCDVNVTHNLVPMAKIAGLYGPMWLGHNLMGYPAAEARELVQAMCVGVLQLLKMNTEEIRRYTPENGWGTYTDLLVAALKILLSCIEYPAGRISISR